MVECILQDKQGFIWLCTGGGLDRFDGYQFTAYKHIPTDSSTISSSTLRGIIEADHGDLYVGTENGLNLFDKATEKFTRPLPVNSGMNNIAISPLFYKNGGLVINARNKGIWEFNTYTHGLKLLIPPSIPLADERIYADDKIILFNPYDKGLGLLNRRTGVISFLDTKGFHYMGFQKYDDSHILCNTDHGICVLDVNTKVFTLLPIEQINHTRINSITIDTTGQFWVAVDEAGLYLFDSKWKLKEIFDNSAFPGLKHIITLQRDRQNNILAGTQDEGLIIISYNNLKFKQPSDRIISQMQSKFIRALYADRDNIYAGTYQKGLQIISRAKGTVQQTMPPVKKGAEGYTVTAIRALPDSNKLFIGTDNGAYIYDKQLRSWREVSFNIMPYRNKKVSGSLYSKSHGLIFYTAEAVYKLYLNNVGYNSERIYISGPLIMGLYADREGRLLITHTGMQLHYLGKDSDKNEATIVKDPHSSIEKNYNWVTSFYDRPDGHKMIGTNSGLIELDAHYSFIRQYGLKEGLPDLYIYSIIPAGGQLWISTNKGLSCMDISNHHFTNYDIADGLKSNEFNSGAFFRDNSFLYFGGPNGFNYFDPEKLKSEPANVTIVPTSFNVFDEPFATDTALSLKHSIALPWSRNTFSMEVSALNFSDPDRTRYAFYLEGSDKHWYATGTRRMVRYSGIAPGEYTLWAKSSGTNGVWGPPKLIMHVNILPPFWKTWWFKVLILLVFAGLAGLIMYIAASRRYQKKLNALKHEQEIEEVRRRLSRDIHDDIGSDLTKISILTERIKNKSLANDAEFIGVLDKLSSHTRNVIGNLGEIVWTVNPQHDNLGSMLAYFRNFINAFFEEGNLEYNIQFKIQDSNVAVNPELRRNLYLVLKECLNNVVKHACATRVDIIFNCCDNQFELIIKDNGKGIKETAEVTFGNGLQNMRKRSGDSQCHIDFESSPEQGTTIRISGKIY